MARQIGPNEKIKELIEERKIIVSKDVYYNGEYVYNLLKLISKYTLSVPKYKEKKLINAISENLSKCRVENKKIKKENEELIKKNSELEKIHSIDEEELKEKNKSIRAFSEQIDEIVKLSKDESVLLETQLSKRMYALFVSSLLKTFDRAADELKRF